MYIIIRTMRIIIRGNADHVPLLPPAPPRPRSSMYVHVPFMHQIWALIGRSGEEVRIYKGESSVWSCTIDKSLPAAPEHRPSTSYPTNRVDWLTCSVDYSVIYLELVPRNHTSVQQAPIHVITRRQSSQLSRRIKVKQQAKMSQRTHSIKTIIFSLLVASLQVSTLCIQ